MTQIEFKDGIRLAVDTDKLRNFLIENGVAYKDYLQYFVRKKLGQNLKSYEDFVVFKAQRSGKFEDRPAHLRFEMCGQRDGDGGIKENREIFKMFNLPITIRSSYDYDSYNASDYRNIFIFHKGTPELLRRNVDGNLVSIASYNGWGTVAILIELIEKFSLSTAIEENLKVL